MKVWYTLFLILITMNGLITAQDMEYKPTLAVLEIDVQNPSFSPLELGDMVRMEASKLDRFDVLDRYDATYLIQKNNLTVENCFGKICLTEIGAKLGVEKMLTGSLETFGETIVITLRLLNVSTGSIEKTEVVEFLNLPQQVRNMLQISTKKLFGEVIDENLLSKLSQQNKYESAISYPEAKTLKLSGPRMGFTYVMGEASSILQDAPANGGFDTNPLMFQIGYQWEIKYLNQGNFQALFEIVPIITGLDQGKFFPSLSLLNGLRSNISGWEFNFGPIFYASTKAKGFFDDDGLWQIKFDETSNVETPVYETRLDSRGDPRISSSFVFAIGKSFKSGNLNIPVNLFYVPRKDGTRIGISVGFNAIK